VETIYSNVYKKMVGSYSYSIKDQIVKRNNITELVQFRAVQLNTTYTSFDVYSFKSVTQFTLWNPNQVTQISRSLQQIQSQSIHSHWFGVQMTS
jgi:hypothetical protein